MSACDLEGTAVAAMRGVTGVAIESAMYGYPGRRA